MKKYKFTLAAVFGICAVAFIVAATFATDSSFAQTPGSTTNPTVKPRIPHSMFKGGVQGVYQEPALTAEEIAAAQVPGPSPWTKTTNSPPAGAPVGTTLLLTDGRVLAHNDNTPDWYTLTPDNLGSYINGTWTKVASLPAGYMPLYFGSVVLRDGRVLIEGGEYNGGSTQAETTKGAIYDPVANTWTTVFPPTGWTSIGDASLIVLEDGTAMLAEGPDTKQAATFNAQTLTWTSFNHLEKFDINSEEGWTLLPNGTLLTIDTYLPKSAYDKNGVNYEIFNPSTNLWSLAGTTPVQLWSSAKGCGGKAVATHEVGPALLLPNNTVFAVGANQCGRGHTAIYNVASETWTAGPDLPDSGGNHNDAEDAPAALEPNGKMLIQTSRNTGCGVNIPYCPPSTFFEWDGTSLTQVAGPPNAVNDASFQGRLLVLPNGQILFTDGSTDIEVFTPSAGNYSYKPTASPPSAVPRGTSFTLEGTKFNGLSQANAYGDDYQSATNYPIVRITNNATGHVFYCRTHDFSYMGVRYNGAVATTVDVPANTETGASKLQVVANGIPSVKYSILIQ